jgi:hypothetical protein
MAALALIGGLVFAALATANADSDGDGDIRKFSPLDRQNALKSSCEAGFTSSCNMIGEKPPKDQQ